MKPIFFPKQEDFRKWLEENHQKETELIVGYYKVNAKKPSMTWSESVDQALCFGWIDGIRKSIDEESYQIRFTPRKSTSIWSAINIKKIEELTEKGLMFPAGIAAFEKRKEHKSKIYTYENKPTEFPKEFLKQFKANKKAWEYFENLAPSYRKNSLQWIMSAKQEITKINRLNKTLEDCEKQYNQWKDHKYKKNSTSSLLHYQEKYKDFSKKIIELKNNDIKLRDKLILEKKLGLGYNEEMEILNTKNALLLNKIIDSIGYPTIEKVGKEANDAAWLVIQHSIGQPDFMKKCKTLLKNVAKKDKSQSVPLAYLSDRIAVLEDQPQLYGTQFDWDKNGELNPCLFDDLTKVNKRRKNIGLNTLEEQIKTMRAQTERENQSPPSDFYKRKIELENWKKLVGWKK